MTEMVPPMEDMMKIVNMVLKKSSGRCIDWKAKENIFNDLDSIEFISLIVGLEEVLNIEFDDDKLLMSSYNDSNEFLEYLICKFLSR